MYGSMEAEFEVPRTIERAELTAFLCLLKKVIGHTKVHVDNKGIIDGLWRGARKCTDPKDLGRVASVNVIRFFGWKRSISKRTAQRTKNEMLQLEKLVTEGNEKGDELAEAGAMLDQGFVAEARAKIVQQEREKKCCQLSLLG